MQYILFGAGSYGQTTYRKHFDKSDGRVIAFADNNPDKQGTLLFSLPVIAPDQIVMQTYDTIYITSQVGEADIVEQLLALGVDPSKIDTSFVHSANQARLVALEKTALYLNEITAPGAVAELGVYQGAFAKEINRVFPDRKLYLFDTFEGFSAKDILMEDAFTVAEEGHLSNTSVEYVLSRMPYKEMCEIRKGYFPMTAEGLDEKFAFVSLDADLYNPMLAGLRFFYPRLCDNGVIFLHDFYSTSFPGAKKAVDEFRKEQSIRLVALGDNCSIALVK